MSLPSCSYTGEEVVDSSLEKTGHSQNTSFKKQVSDNSEPVDWICQWGARHIYIKFVPTRRPNRYRYQFVTNIWQWRPTQRHLDSVQWGG